jgi:hypothetical protein
MKKMFVLFAIVAFVASTAFVAIADNGPASIKLDVKMGAVTLDHAKHQGLTDCVACHHTDADPKAAVDKCKSCHNAKPEAPKSKKVYHKLCKDCHKKSGGAAPTKCKGCHVK